MILPDDVGEALRPQPVGQRVRRLASNRVLIGEGVDLILTAVRLI